MSNLNETACERRRREGYEAVLEEIRANRKNRSDFENAIVEKIHRWWKEWVPDYEGWCKIADWLYAEDCMMKCNEGPKELFRDYRAGMRHQRDTFTMEMGHIEKYVVEGDTIAISYDMYLTPKADMGPFKAGVTCVAKVTEFNTFKEIPGSEPMVSNLLLNICPMTPVQE